MNMEYIAPKPTMEYKVLIKCITYNQEEYIEDALKGFVRQKTNFPFCAIVVDDCSTDGTAEIIKKYEREYPDIIKGIYLPVNMYGNPKKREYIKPWEEKAQYIALCEGDDYWIDNHKLQRQVELLDSDPNCSLCYHACKNVFEDNYKGEKIPVCESVMERLTYKAFIPGYPFQTASVVYRANVHNSPLYKKVSSNGGMTSAILFITVGQSGYFRGFNEQMAVYRRNGGGISVANKVDVQKSFIKKQILICGFYTPEVKKQFINKSILPNLRWLYSKSKREFMQMAFLSFKNHPSIIFSLVRVFIVLFSKKILRYVGLPFVTK